MAEAENGKQKTGKPRTLSIISNLKIQISKPEIQKNQKTKRQKQSS
jgi:hypothetical protein